MTTEEARKLLAAIHERGWCVAAFDSSLYTDVIDRVWVCDLSFALWYDPDGTSYWYTPLAWTEGHCGSCQEPMPIYLHPLDHWLIPSWCKGWVLPGWVSDDGDFSKFVEVFSQKESEVDR